MKNIVIVAIILFSCLTVGCRQSNAYVIEGTLYGGRNFEDQVIYLVPFSATKTGQVDSAVIHNSRFRFEGRTDKDAVYCLRMRPMMRLFIEELVIIREPGHLRTRLSQVSYAKGTPQNDSLQNWREFKMRIDSAQICLKKTLKKIEKTDLEKAAVIKAKSDSLANVFDQHNRATVSVNNNAFGEYVEHFLR